MKRKALLCTLLLALLVLPVTARADVIVPGQKPPEPEPETVAFEVLYGDQFVDFDPVYTAAITGPVALWIYPGAAEPKISTEVGDYPANGLSPCYVDGDGHFWGYVGYLHGIRFTWVCLSDPGGESLQPNQSVITAVEELVEEAERAAMNEKILAVVLVAAVVVVTALLIVRLKRKKRA